MLRKLAILTLGVLASTPLLATETQACLGARLLGLDELEANGCDHWEHSGVEHGAAVFHSVR